MAAINDARDVLTDTALVDFSSWLRRAGGAIAGAGYPRTPRGIRVMATLNELSLQRELLFAVGSLLPVSSHLREFAAVETDIDEAIRQGRPSKATEGVLVLERRFGMSVWATTIAFTVVAASHGMDGQKSVLREMRSADRASGLVQFVAYCASMRVEPANTAAGYEDACIEMLSRMSGDLPKNVLALISRHLLPYAAYDEETVAAALRLEATGSIIDYYQSLCWALLHVCRFGTDSSELLQRVGQLAEEVGSRKLHRIADAVAHRARGDGRPVWYPSLAFREHPLGFAWVALSQSDATSDPFELRAAIRPASTVARDALWKRAQSNPFDLDTVGAWASAHLEAVDSPSRDWFEVIAAVGGATVIGSDVTPSFPINALGSLDRARWLTESGDPQAALHLLASARLHSDDLWYRRKICLMVDAMVASGDEWSAFVEVVRTGVRSPDLLDALPLLALTSLIDRRSAVFHELSRRGPETAIVVDLLCKHRAQRFEVERRRAVEAYLRARGCRRPSELRAASLGEYDQDVLVWFLRDVCVETVIDKFGCFSSAREVAEERVEICRWLVDLGEGDTVRGELTGILRRIMVAEGMEKLQRSKVFVGLEGFRSTAQRRTREMFDRFVALPEDAHAVHRADAIDVMMRVARDGQYDDYLALSLPKNERSDLMVKLLTLLRDDFVHGPQHGLDGYLSVRIRHGAIRNYLRAPFDDEALSTVKSEDARGYEDNPKWADLLEALPPAIHPNCRDIFKRLAQRLDDLTEELNSWLQIRTTKEGSGLFDFVLAERDVAVMMEIGSRYPWEVFLEQVEQYFLARLDVNLDSIRNAIRGRAKIAASEMVRSAIQEFEELNANHLDISDVLGRLNRVHTSLQNAMEGLSEWFQRTPVIASEPFDVEDAVRIAAETVRRGPGAITPRITREGNATAIHGVFFQPIVDVFTLLIDNAVRHSGLQDPMIDIRIIESSRRVSTEVRNSLSPAAAAASAARLTDIQSRLNDPSQMAYVRKEGGSGIVKLHKILLHDLGADSSVLMMEVSEDLFVISFQFPIHPPDAPLG